jgi:hypothetical protein
MSIPAGIVSVMVGFTGITGVELTSKSRRSTDPNSVEMSNLMAVGFSLNIRPLTVDDAC